MRELERWLDCDPPPEMAEMLQTAQSDEPRREVVERTLAVLGVAAAVGATGLVGAAHATGWAKIAGAKISTLLVIAKWGAVGAIAGVAALGAVTVTRELATSPVGEPPAEIGSKPNPDQQRAAGGPASPSVVIPRDEPEVAPSRRVVGSLPDVGPPPSAAVRLPSSPSVARFAPVDEVTPPADPSVGTRLAPPVQAAPNPGSARYQRELALVDAARAAVEAREPARALSWLAQYEREFGGSGNFAPEARLLRLQAYRLAGDAPRARGAARAILSADPRGPHAERAREVLRTTP